MIPNRLASARKFLSILLASLALAGESSAARQVAAQSEALPLIRSQQNHLLVRAMINGRPAWLGVDSGAPVSAIALHRRSYYKLNAIPSSSSLPPRLQINGAFNNVAVVKSLRLGKLNLVDEPVVIVDLRGSGRAARLLEEQEIDGILGADILFPAQAVLDCQRKLLVLKTFPDAPGRPTGFDYRGFSAIPMQVSDGFNLYVNAAINGKAARLMVDSGAFTTLLHQPFVRGLHIPTRDTPFSSAAVNLKQRGVRIARIQKLSVGSVDIVGKDVGVIDLEGLIHGRLLKGKPPVAGLLGAEILNHNHGIIDFGTRTLYLKQKADRLRPGTRRSAMLD